ncbi:MAG: serine hydrolase domain-containing protein [Microbacterium sp.]
MPTTAATRTSKLPGRILTGAAAFVAIVAAVFAGNTHAVQARLKRWTTMSFDELIGEATAGNRNAVITVAVIEDGEVTTTVYGHDATILPSERRVYEIGSITKTFTTALLSKAIDEGRISLDDSIDEYLDLPPKDYYPTIRRIATHSSGYKREYLALNMIQALFGANPFHGITKDSLLKRVATIQLDDKDYPLAYSNFGMAVLGAVLEEVYGENYTSLMNKFVRTDLGLHDTMISDGSGNDRFWKWSADDAYAPAGALVSTIEDMVEYAKLQLVGEPAYLADAHRPLAQGAAEEPATNALGVRIDRVGLGWVIDTEHDIVWHNGGTGNYNSYLGFDAHRRLAVVMLANYGDGRVSATIMGAKLLQSLQGKAPVSP